MYMGKTIIPSARKSIHSNPSAGLDTMKNTIKKINATEKHSQVPDIGVDEIDNVQSKPVPPLSPRNQERKLPSRRDLYADCDDESSSDEETSDSEYADCNSCELPLNETSYSKRGYSAVRSLSRSNSVDERNINTEYKTKYYYVACLIAIVSLIYYYNEASGTEKTIHNTYDKFNFYNDVKSLAQKYKVKGDSMLQIQAGINTIFERRDTGSFIFVYDGGMENFDPVIFNYFIDNVASAASRYLRNDTKNVQHVVLDSSKIASLKSDYDLINQFRDKVDRRGVLLVKDVATVPAELAMAFHYYCDEYNPLVKKSAIFFTLNVAECSITSSQKSTHDYIEQCLKAKWKDVPSDKLGPLLTRVVNVIVDVMSV